MNGRNKIIVVTAAALLMTCQGAIAKAQEEQGITASSTQAQEAGQTLRGNSANRLRRANEMQQKPEIHKNRIAQIVEDEKKQLNALREDRTLSMEQKKEKALLIREDTHAKMRTFLSPEEQKKYDMAREKERQFREAMRKRKGTEIQH